MTFKVHISALKMEPDDTADYSKKCYWDSRYSREDEYDWFASIYHDSVDIVFESIERTAKKQAALRTNDELPVLKVLHLGNGNSRLCFDVYETWMRKYQNHDTPPYDLLQVAIDYSSIVIRKMESKFPNCRCSLLESGGVSRLQKERQCSFHVKWLVADIRRLSCIKEKFGSFDVIVDKGTMDSLQADKNSSTVESDIHDMLDGVSG